MLSRIVMAMAVALAGSFAQAGTGTSKLQFFGAGSGGYELTMEGDTITGWIDGFGSMSGKVALVKKDGKWSGRLGMMQIKAGAMIQTAENKTKVSMSTLPGGNHSFNFKIKATELQMNGMMSNGLMVSANHNATKNQLGVWNSFISQDIRSKNADGMYKGTTMIRMFNGQYEYLPTELKATGDLMPSALAKNDHALFVLLHVIPLNRFN